MVVGVQEQTYQLACSSLQIAAISSPITLFPLQPIGLGHPALPTFLFMLASPLPRLTIRLPTSPALTILRKWKFTGKLYYTPSHHKGRLSLRDACKTPSEPQASAS